MLDEQIPQALKLTLFRILVRPTMPLYPLEIPREEIIKTAATAPLSLKTRKNSTWKIGNVRIEEQYIYLRIGRIRLDHQSILDSTGDFVDTENEVAPYSHVFINTAIGICSISRNVDLSYLTESISIVLTKLLNESLNRRDIAAEIELEPIKDPIEFIIKLQSAHLVTKLWVTVKRPNPLDVNRDFTLPTSRVLEELNGDESTTGWSGNALNVRQPGVVDIINSAATTGGNARATIKKNSNSPLLPITMTSNLARLGTFSRESIRNIFNEISESYNQIRTRGRNNDSGPE